jgi:hypothetical protein
MQGMAMGFSSITILSRYTPQNSGEVVVVSIYVLINESAHYRMRIPSILRMFFN